MTYAIIGFLLGFVVRGWLSSRSRKGEREEYGQLDQQPRRA
ncbi:hypothetical protein [Mesorhizobium sp.]|nr:hypothetical protein [Mesorhizobium sp.]